MTDPQDKPKEVNIKGTGFLNRLTKEEFLMQLDTAVGWMLWVNPAVDEVELIVKDTDGQMTAFHGPDPMSMPFAEYKAFAAEVDKMSDGKEEPADGGQAPDQ